MFRLLCCLSIVLVAHAATPLFQSSFDKQDQGWTALSGTAALDSRVLHDNSKSLRLEAADSGAGPVVRLAPIALTIGRRYELSGWVRTEDLAVQGSRPFPDRHGRRAHAWLPCRWTCTRPPWAARSQWTRLSLQFIASRAQDAIVLTAGSGGALRGKAWFEGVSLDEASSADEWPAREAVQTFGPAYRYPSAGWIYLHIEGAPYERGYQHGHLMAREIPEYLERCAADLGSKATVGPVPHHGQRAFPARLRPRNPGGDARHRRWRIRRRRQVAGPPHRPDGYRGGQRHGGIGRARARRFHHPDRPGRAQLR